MCSSYGEYVGDSVADEEFVVDENEPPYLTVLDMGNCTMEGETTVPYFTYYSKLEEVILPHNITKIGYDIDPVFECSYKLKKVILPETLKEINSCSFANCNLQEIILPERLEAIGGYAFNNNKNLKTVLIPKNLSYIDGSAFKDCNVEKFELNENNPHLSIIDGVIFNKDKTKLIAFPSACKNEHYTVPFGTKIIGYSAFCDAKIKTITIPQSVECIEDFAFEFSKIREIEIPDTVTELGEWAFGWCYLLEKIQLPNKITVLNKDIFCGCEKLKELDIPASVKIIEDDAICCAHNLKKLILHDGLEEINDDLKFTKIGKVYIPKTVKKILSGTPLLAKHYKIQFEVDVENPYLSSIDGSLYNKKKTILISAYRKNSKKFVVPDGVTKIADYVFMDAQIEDIVLPESLTTLGHRCFDSCNHLKEIRLPKSLISMDFRAFDDCKKLERMEIYAEEPPKITNPCWKFMNDSQTLSLYVPKGSVETYKAAKYWKDIKKINPL
jgi:hypothetical protein